MCITGGMLGPSPVCVAEVASASSSAWVVPIVFLVLALNHQNMKGETKWPTDVDVMEDGE